MRQAIVLVSGAILLAGCAQQVWKADKSRYPTKEVQDMAFERYSDHCQLKSRVIVAQSETTNQPQTTRSGHRIVHDNALFKACMEAAGFRLVRENPEQTPSTPKEPAEKSDENPEREVVAAAPPAEPVPGSPAMKTTEPEVASPRAAPPADTPPPATPPARAMAADSPFRIQLAAARTRALAEQEWARLQAALPEVFATRELIIVKKELAGRGTFYRVQTGGFDTLQEARSMCAILHARKQACFPVERS